MGNKASASASFDVEASANVEAGANGEGPAKKKRKLSFSKLLPRRSASLAREKGNVEGGNGGGKHVRPLSYRGTADLDADVEFNSPDANISAEVTTPSASDAPETSATAKARAGKLAAFDRERKTVRHQRKCTITFNISHLNYTYSYICISSTDTKYSLSVIHVHIILN